MIPAGRSDVWIPDAAGPRFRRARPVVFLRVSERPWFNPPFRGPSGGDPGIDSRLAFRGPVPHHDAVNPSKAASAARTPSRRAFLQRTAAAVAGVGWTGCAGRPASDASVADTSSAREIRVRVETSADPLGGGRWRFWPTGSGGAGSRSAVCHRRERHDVRGCPGRPAGRPVAGPDGAPRQQRAPAVSVHSRGARLPAGECRPVVRRTGGRRPRYPVPLALR
jgi:hypothetical protein